MGGGWTHWRVLGKVDAHLGRRKFRLKRHAPREGEPDAIIVTLHPAAPPPLPPVGRWIIADCWRGVLMVVCIEWVPLERALGA